MLYEVTYAADDGLGLGGIFSASMNFGDFFLLLISLFVLAAGALSLVFVLYGGLLLILSGGKDEKIKPAINTIRYAVIGIIVTVLSIFLFPILGRLLGLDVEEYAQPNRIFDKIEEIGNTIFNGGGSSSSSIGSGSSGGSSSNIDDFPDDFSDL